MKSYDIDGVLTVPCEPDPRLITANAEHEGKS